MTSISAPILGSFVRLADLFPDEQALVHGSWAAAEHAYTPLSHFPVGAAVYACNDLGFGKIFGGSNVENRFMSCTICAERNAITTAVAEGYRDLKKIALVCKLYHGPGAAPCALCRQVMIEFGLDAVVLQAADAERSVTRYLVRDLLPAAKDRVVALAEMGALGRRNINKLLKLSEHAHVPYSKKHRAALFFAFNDKGQQKVFPGVNDDNASYGGSAAAETVAMRSARTAGYVRNPRLMVLVDDPTAINPVEGESLQVLREFGINGLVELVGPDGASVVLSIGELLPDSFGPESLV